MIGGKTRELMERAEFLRIYKNLRDSPNIRIERPSNDRALFYPAKGHLIQIYETNLMDFIDHPGGYEFSEDIFSFYLEEIDGPLEEFLSTQTKGGNHLLGLSYRKWAEFEILWNENDIAWVEIGEEGILNTEWELWIDGKRIKFIEYD